MTGAGAMIGMTTGAGGSGDKHPCSCRASRAASAAARFCREFFNQLRATQLIRPDEMFIFIFSFQKSMCFWPTWGFRSKNLAKNKKERFLLAEILSSLESF